MVTVGGLLTSAIVKMVGDKLGSAIGEQASLVWNVRKHMEDMKDMLETIGAVLQDAEKRLITEAEVRLWLKRLKNAAYDISDMIDDFQGTGEMTGILPTATRKILQASKMKRMREKLRKIEEQHKSFKFRHDTTTIIIDHLPYDQRETTSDVNELDIIGRDAEKQALIDLLSANHDKDETKIVPIYGLGGIGKTTLAGMIYNDTQFNKYDHRVWVYVSQVFDLKKIGRSIISQLPIEASQQNTDTMQLINQCLDDLIPGKRILIVLDDLWEERDFELEKLKRMLRVGKRGSFIDVIVTTRKEDIANKINTNEPYMLQPMKDDMCWGIIRRYSQVEHKANKEQFVQTGLDIAKKCGGVALAAQALGYMLKSKDLRGWYEVNNSDIWNGSSDDDSSPHNAVLPSLKLSYEKMPPHLRLCFSYCAIFLKGHDIVEDDLIHQWIALDFVIHPSMGKEYTKQLLGMSFLQHSKLPSITGKDAIRYTMHDLVHDLARSVIGDELLELDDATKRNTIEQKYCRYVLLTNNERPLKLSNILPSKVRAVHFSNGSKLNSPGGTFSFAKCLRIVDFSGCSTILLSDCLGHLKQLRCLIAPRMQNKRVPECVTELLKLQYLNMRGSSQISALPELIGKHGCLLYLGLSGCSAIPKLPESFGDLKSMVHLDMSGCSSISKLPESIGDLKRMVHLDMSGCSEIEELPDSLGNLTNLQHLELSRCFSVRAIPESFCGLTQLQYLKLSYCLSLVRLPEAIGSLVHLRYLNLSGCREIRELPDSFKKLQNLLHLDLTNCIGLGEWIPGTLSVLTALQHLDMSHLFFKYPCIRVDFISSLTSLEHLDLSYNRMLEYLPEGIGNFKRLHTLNLSGCGELKCLPESIGAISTLKSLSVEWCSDEIIDQAYSRCHYSLTLPLFKVRTDDVWGCSNLHLLEGVNVGELRIRSLENTKFVEEAREVKLWDKQNLSKLTLVWTLGADRLLEDKDLLGELVPPRGLKDLKLQGYSSTGFPSWLMGISHHLPNLVSILLIDLPKCSSLPPLGQLPNLKYLDLTKLPSITKIDKDFCGGKGAFRKLSTFSLEIMQGLEEWSTRYAAKDGVEEFMFPMLDQLCIENCPRLRLKRYPPTFRECKLYNSDEVISSLGEEDTIGHLSYYTRSTKLRVWNSKCQSMRMFRHFPTLEKLELCHCDYLTSLPESMRNLSSLQSLELGYCENISALPEWLGDLSSLRSLIIEACVYIMSLPVCIQRLTNLQKLHISRNSELIRWCESEDKKKKLAHINDKEFYGL